MTSACKVDRALVLHLLGCTGASLDAPVSPSTSSLACCMRSTPNACLA